MPELMKIGKPFGAVASKRQGAIMVEPEGIGELVEMIKKTNHSMEKYQ